MTGIRGRPGPRARAIVRLPSMGASRMSRWDHPARSIAGSVDTPAPSQLRHPQGVDKDKKGDVKAENVALAFVTGKSGKERDADDYKVTLLIACQ